MLTPAGPDGRQAIMRAFRAAGALAVQQVRDSAVSVEGASEEETKDLLRKCAATTLNSKLVRAPRPLAPGSDHPMP